MKTASDRVMSPPRIATQFVLTSIRVIWALPWTMFGVILGICALLTGGRVGFSRGVVEFCGGSASRILRLSPFLKEPAAVTFGHTILARSREDLENTREHELVHVRQYEQWGIFFIPVYLLWSGWLWIRGKHPYLDNPFEQEAYGLRSEFGIQAPCWLLRLLNLGVLGACAGLVLTIFSRSWWIAELATHFYMFYLATAVVVATLWWIMGRIWRSVAAGCVACVLLINLIPFYYSRTTGPANTSAIRILSANVLSRNANYNGLLQLIQTEAPDVILVMEVNENWRNALSQLSEKYPHRKVVSRPDNFGIAMFSRLPLDDLTTELLGEVGVPCIVARMTVGNRPLTVIGVHVVPPMRSVLLAERNEAFERVARLALESNGEVVVVGDLNCTSWSPYFRDLLSVTNLSDSRLGFGLQPSWPTHPLPLLPIDHCLVTNGIVVRDRRLGPDIGSDHLPVLIDVSLREAK